MQRRRQSGYWRQADDSAVSSSEASDAWARAAYPALITVAETYHRVITYGELGEMVQRDSGIRTSLLLQNWIGEVLKRVVGEAHRRGDPSITALVVHAVDGKVGLGYRLVLQTAGEPAIEDEIAREEHASRARLNCYRRFCAFMPADGGVPALAPKLEAKLRPRQLETADARERTCPRCHVVLPLSGVCDTCG